MKSETLSLFDEVEESTEPSEADLRHRVKPELRALLADETKTMIDLTQEVAERALKSLQQVEMKRSAMRETKDALQAEAQTKESLPVLLDNAKIIVLPSVSKKCVVMRIMTQTDVLEIPLPPSEAVKVSTMLHKQAAHVNKWGKK